MIVLYVFDKFLKVENPLIFYFKKSLVVFTLFTLLVACGGPPQNIVEGSETPAQLALSAESSIQFDALVNGFHYQPTLTIKNLSNTVPATQMEQVNQFVSPFSLISSDCQNQLNPGSTCSIQVSIDPVASGPIASEIIINYFDGLADQSLSLALSGSSREPLPAVLSQTPSSNHDFGVIAIGGFSSLVVNLNNAGEQDATSLSFTGLSAPYSITNNTCSTVLAANDQCQLQIDFNPTLQVISNQSLTISYFDGTQNQNLTKSLSGEGRVAGFLSVNEGLNQDFQTLLNGFNKDLTLTITNTGGGNVDQVQFTGLNSPVSLVSHNCPSSLTPTQSCQIQVRLTSTGNSAVSQDLQVLYSDGFSSQSTVIHFDGQPYSPQPALTLLSPSSPANNNQPNLRVSQLMSGLTVHLYRNSTCSQFVSSSVSLGTQINISPTVSEGQHQFHVVIEDQNGNLSSCSTSFVDYEYDNTAPLAPSTVTLTSTITTQSTTTPNVTWSSSSSSDVVDYRLAVSTSSAGGNSVSGFTSQGLVTSGQLTGLSLTECQSYYVSVDTIDDVGLNSLSYRVSSQSFVYDSALPTAPGQLSEQGDSSPTNSATVTWEASSDACGISRYQVAISRDDNSNDVLDASEVGNVVAFTDVGNITSHRFNSISLVSGVKHFTSVRAVDNSGRLSTASVSDPWIVYDPSIELPAMIVWLDGNDLATVLDENGRNALNPAFSGQVNRWSDKSGSSNSHDFTAVNGSSRPSFSGLDFSVDFDGSTTVMSTPNHSEINTSTVDQRNITVAFKSSADITSRQVLYEEGGNVRGMNIYIYNGQLYCGFYNNTSDTDGIQPFTWVNSGINTNSVYFVTWVFDYTNYTSPTGPDGSLSCYVNGSLIGSTTTTSRLFAHSGAVGLGAVNSQSVFEDGSIPSSGHHFMGQLYEVMLFNDAPSLTDITNIHTYLDNKWN